VKRFFGILAIALLVLVTALSRPALAADADHGAKIFKANCTACHIGGRNSVSAAKTLQKDALTTYGMYSAEAIINQVTNGKGAMPSFAGRLSATDIEDVAAYVLAQADSGWQKR
jgi:cytochrome c6